MAEPRASRPDFDPAYGISAERDGLLPWSWAVERLEAARNYWVSTTRPDGRPHAMPVWGVWVGGAVVFGTAAGSAKAHNLETNSAAVVHLESGDEVVILEGAAERVGTAYPGLAEAYEAKYDMTLDVATGEGAPWFAVRPTRAYAWLERDYLRTVTRFDFGD